MKQKKVRPSKTRIEERISEISTFNLTPGQGTTRPTFSEPYIAASKYLFDIMEGLGLETGVTCHGNMIATWEGENNQPGILLGSHIDSVPHGGNYDGVTGVIAAIEAVQCLKKEGFKPLKPVHIIVFAEEEGTTFGHMLVGSKASLGQITQKKLASLKNKEGKSYLECAEKFQKIFGKPLFDYIRPEMTRAMLELHVEQSVVLEEKNFQVGIVTEIAGAQEYIISIKGLANHAGATPMKFRLDAVAGLGEAIVGIEKTITKHKSPLGVATVGSVSCFPGAANIIAGEASFSLDIRDVKKENLEILERNMLSKIGKIMDKRNLSLEINRTSSSIPIVLDEGIRSLLEEVAEDNNIPVLKMPSGAVHDSAEIARFIPTGMIFVPSKNGRSHCSEEYTNAEDITQGCTILKETIRKLSLDQIFK